MSKHFRWVETTGGPHILLPVENLISWRGIEGWRDNCPEDRSDYARACRSDHWLSTIPAGDGMAVVLGGDVGPISWVPDFDGKIGVLIQVLASDGDEAVLSLLKGLENISSDTTVAREQIDFETGISGTLVLMDASNAGSEIIDDCQIVALRPGRYRATAFCAENDGCAVVLRELVNLSG